MKASRGPRTVGNADGDAPVFGNTAHGVRGVLRLRSWVAHGQRRHPRAVDVGVVRRRGRIRERPRRLHILKPLRVVTSGASPQDWRVSDSTVMAVLGLVALAAGHATDPRPAHHRVRG